MEYVQPRVDDYGTLVEMTKDDFLMRHFGIAQAAATLPVTPDNGGGGPVGPSGGGGGGGGEVQPIVLPGAEAPDAGAVTPQAVGAEGAEPTAGAPGGEVGAEEGPAGGAGPAGVTGAPGAGGDELPFTGLDVAATAAAGAASLAAGVALREASKKPSSQRPTQPRTGS
jgi:hypothetical protein